MGFKFLQKYTPVKTNKRLDKDEEATIFRCTWPKIGCDAQGIIVPEGILVLKGSKVRHGIAKSFVDSGYYIIRKKLEDEKILVDDLFVTDYLFSSYAAAASVICGHHSGRSAWSNDAGQTIDEYLSN